MSASNKNLIPAAIILAGLVLSVTIFVLRHEDAPTLAAGDITKVLPIGPMDHVTGDLTPKVTVITYTDLDCQFCKRFQEVTDQLAAEYGTDGGVAFAVRHFPILDLHPNAGSHAKAAECAAKLGGEPAFWDFIHAIHAAAPEGAQFSPNRYGEIAKGLGISEENFITCTNSSEFDDRVARDFENGLLIGAKGTPFSVIMVDGMEPFAVSGYLPYEGMKTVIERTLSSIR